MMDAIFVDWRNENFWIKDDPRVTDVGATHLGEIAAPLVDMDGVSRSLGSAPDLGALEHVP